MPDKNNKDYSGVKLLIASPVHPPATMTNYFKLENKFERMSGISF